MPTTYTPKPCRKCGGPKERNVHGRLNGWYCNACGDKLWVKYDLDNRYCKDRTEEHQRWNCLDCQRAKTERLREAASRGAATRAKNNPTWRKPFNAQKYWQSRAHASVQAAIKLGLIPCLKDGEYACTDCGDVALEYDHRDYGRPLHVEPVCRSCNHKRGTAIWPAPDHFHFAKLPKAAKPPKQEAA